MIMMKNKEMQTMKKKNFQNKVKTRKKKIVLDSANVNEYLKHNICSIFNFNN